jgi:hypothetical protein
MVLLFFWIGFAVIVGVAANSRGRNGIYWGLLAMLISPLLAGPLLFALPRLDPLNDIAALALFEATPEGSRSRQLFAERQAKQATQSAQSLAKREALLDRFGVGALRSDYKKSEWHDEAVRKGRTSFKVGMCIWAGFLLIGLVAVLSGPLKSQSTTPVAAQAAPATAKPMAGQEVSEKYRDHVFIEGHAGWKCKKAIENAAKYDVRWTSWFSDFSRWNKYARADGYIRFSGDDAEAQNGFGNWVRANYSCLFDPATSTVISVSIEPGKLPKP